MILYYNPHCSKCQKALEILKTCDVEFDTVNVLERQLTPEEIERFYAAFGSKLLREKLLEELECRVPSNLEDVILALQSHPQVMERPILVSGERLIIARPPELLLEFLGI